MREHAGQSWVIVVNEGEILCAFIDEDAALAYAYQINNCNTLSAIEESGREVEDLTDEEYAEFEYMGGFEGGYAYAETVRFPSIDDFDYDTDEENEEAYREAIESDYITDENDVLSWDDILSAVIACENVLYDEDYDEDNEEWA